MATVATPYSQFPSILIDDTIEPETATWRARLVTSVYTPSAAHTVWADASAHEVVDASYSAKTITNVAVTATAITGDNPTWPALDATFRYLILTVEQGGTEYLIAYYLLDDTPADVTIAGADYTPGFDTGVIADIANTP